MTVLTDRSGWHSCLFLLALSFGGCAPCQTAEDCGSPPPCYEASCSAGGCVWIPDDACCAADSDCNDGETCTIDSCDTSSGTCLNRPACSDGNFCNGEEQCTPNGDSYTCEAATGNPCDDGDLGTQDTCDGSACRHQPIAGFCVSAQDCDDSIPCTVDSCQLNTCKRFDGCPSPFKCDNKIRSSAQSGQGCTVSCAGTRFEPTCGPTGGDATRPWTALNIDYAIVFDGLPESARLQELTHFAASEWSAASNVKLQSAEQEDSALLTIRFCGLDAENESCAILQDPLGPYGGYAQPPNALEPVFAVIDAKPDSIGDESVLYAILLHELGHALGLGHLDDFDAIMHTPVNSHRIDLVFRNNLTHGDRAAIQAIYGDGDESPRPSRLDLSGLNCPPFPGTDEPDTDGDGLPNAFELFELFTNPADSDSDADGFDDPCEVILATDPNDPDSDGDGRRDGIEVDNHREPRPPIICDEPDLGFDIVQLSPAYLDDFDLADGLLVRVKNIERGCEAHGLRIEVTAEPGCGALFSRTRREELCFQRANVAGKLRICPQGTTERVLEDFSSIQSSELSHEAGDWILVNDGQDRHLEFRWLINDVGISPFLEFRVDPLLVGTCDSLNVLLSSGAQDDIHIELKNSEGLTFTSSAIRLFPDQQERVELDVASVSELASIRFSLDSAGTGEAGVFRVDDVLLIEAGGPPTAQCPPNCPPQPGACDLLVWTDDLTAGSISTISLDGENARSVPAERPRGIAVGAEGTLYWTSDGVVDTVFASSLTLDQMSAVHDSGLSCPAGITIDKDGDAVYWVDACLNKVLRKSLNNATDIIVLTTSPNPDPQDIAFDHQNRRVLWSDRRHIMQAQPNLTNVAQFWPPADWDSPSENPQGLALDEENGFIYWADYLDDYIWRADLMDASNRILVANLEGDGRVLEDVAIDPAGGRIFWTDNGRNRIEYGNLLPDGRLDPSTIRTIRDNISSPSNIVFVRISDALCE